MSEIMNRAPSFARIAAAGMLVLSLGGCGDPLVSHDGRTLVRQCFGGGWLVKDRAGTLYLRGIFASDGSIDVALARGANPDDVCPRPKEAKP